MLTIKKDEKAAYAKSGYIRTSTRKLNLVAQLIRGLRVSRAMDVLLGCQKRPAQDVRRVLMAAIANAENNQQLDIDRLRVMEASVGKAFSMKRVRPHARGRRGVIKKEFSRLLVVVREQEGAE